LARNSRCNNSYIAYLYLDVHPAGKTFIPFSEGKPGERPGCFMPILASKEAVLALTPMAFTAKV
jgi:hypothetical protein